MLTFLEYIFYDFDKRMDLYNHYTVKIMKSLSCGASLR